MRCENCGKANDDGARVCVNCGMRLGPDPEGRRLSPWAIAALIASLGGAVTFGLGSVLGLLLGVVALMHAKASRGRTGGECLAIVSLVISVATIGLWTPLFLRARAKSLQASCHSNIEQLALGCRMYAADHDGRLPLAENWCDASLEYTKTEYVYACPARKRQRCGYAYNEALSGLAEEEVGSPAAAVMVFDAYGGWNSAGGTEIVAARHDYGANIAFVDGHCMWVRSYGPHAISWDPSWTQSHPPSEQWSTGRPLPRSAKSEGEPAEESLPPDQH